MQPTFKHTPPKLGHRSITTTEEHYGHLETSFVREAAARTEALIASSAA